MKHTSGAAAAPQLCPSSWFNFVSHGRNSIASLCVEPCPQSRFGRLFGRGDRKQLRPRSFLGAASHLFCGRTRHTRVSTPPNSTPTPDLRWRLSRQTSRSGCGLSQAECNTLRSTCVTTSPRALGDGPPAMQAGFHMLRIPKANPNKLISKTTAVAPLRQQTVLSYPRRLGRHFAHADAPKID